MALLTIEKVATLDTKRILAYKKTIQNGPRVCYHDCECDDCIEARRFWNGYMDAIKTILATREHVATPGKEAASLKRRLYHARVKSWRNKLKWK